MVTKPLHRGLASGAPMKLLDLPFLADITTIRRDIHAHPELAFEESRTADVVARALESYGIEVHRGLAGTGVSTLR